MYMKQRIKKNKNESNAQQPQSYQDGIFNQIFIV